MPLAPPPPPVVIGPPVSFGAVGVRVGARTERVDVYHAGRKVAARTVRPGPRRLSIAVPAGDGRVRVRAFGPGGARWSSPGTVTVLPRSARRLGRLPGRLDPIVQRRIAAVMRSSASVSGAYVHDLRSGCAAAVNAGARFPGASTLKASILLEAIRRGYGRSAFERSVLDEMVIPSDDRAANRVLAWIGGGSPEVGGARVTAMVRRLGLRNTSVRRGYLIEAAAAVPIVSERQPALYTNFITTPYDLATQMVAMHRGALGRGGTRRVGLGPTRVRREVYARLLRSADRNKIVAGAPAGTAVIHKSGYTTQVKHDSGIVYLPRGPLVVVVMNWSAGGVSDAVGSRTISQITRIAVERLGRSRACR